MLLTIQINGETKTLLEYLEEELLIELPNQEEAWVNENLSRAQGSINYMVRGKITDQASFDILETNAQTHVFNAICRLANYWIVNKIFSEGETNSGTTGALSYSQSNSRAPDFAPQDVRDQLELSGLYVQQHLVTSGDPNNKTLLELACGDVGKFDITYGEYLSATQDWCLATFEPKGGEGGGSTTSHITRTIASEGEGATQEAINIDKEQRLASHTTSIAGLVAKTADINIPQANYLNLGRTGHSLIQLNQANQSPFIHFYVGLTTKMEVEESGVKFRHLPAIKSNEVIPDLTEDRQFVTKLHLDRSYNTVDTRLDNLEVSVDDLEAKTAHIAEGTLSLPTTTIGENRLARIKLYYGDTKRIFFSIETRKHIEIDNEGVQFRVLPRIGDNQSIPELTALKQFVTKKHLDIVDDKFLPIDTKIERFEQQLSNIDADGNVAEYTADIVTANRKKFASVEHLIGVTNTMASNSTRLNHVEAKTSNLDTNGRVINQPTQANDIATKTYVDSSGGGGGATETYVNWVQGTLPTYHETLTLLDLKNLLDNANTDKITFYSDAQVRGGARTEMLKAFGILDYVATYTQLGTAFRDGDWTGPNAIQGGDYFNSTIGTDIGIGFTSFQQDTTTQTLTDNDWRSKPNGAQGEFQGTRFFSPKSTLEANANSAWVFGQSQSGFGNRSLSIAFHLDNDFTTGTPLPELTVKLNAWIVDTSSNTAVDSVELGVVHDGVTSNIVPQTGLPERNTIFINDYTYRRFDTKVRLFNDYGVANRALVYYYSVNFKNDNNGSPYKLKNVRTFVSRVNRAYKEDELEYYGANAKIVLSRAHADNTGASYSIALSSRRRSGYFEVPFGSMIQQQVLRTGIGRGILFPVENNLWYIAPLVNKDVRLPLLLEASSDVANMGTQNFNSLWQDLHFNMIVRNRAKNYDEAWGLDTTAHTFTIPYDTHRKGIKKLFFISMSGPGFLHQQQMRFRVVDSSVQNKAPLTTGTALGSWTSSTKTTSSAQFRSNGYTLFFYADLETGRSYKIQFYTAAWGTGKPNPTPADKFYLQVEEKF